MPTVTTGAILGGNVLREPASIDLSVLKKRDVLPRFKDGLTLSLASNKLGDLKTVDLSQFEAVAKHVAKLDLEAAEMPAVMEQVFNVTKSKRKAIRVSKAILSQLKKPEDTLRYSRQMVNWARQRDGVQKEIVCKTLIESNQAELLVHNIGGMKKEDADAFMQVFFKSGGQRENVYQWLAEAGNFLRKNKVEHPDHQTTDGFFDDVWGAITGALDWIWGAIKTVANAVKAAGENLVRAIGEIVGWTLSKLADVVRALIQAGKAVAHILAAAIRTGISALKKFVKAIIRAGRRMLEVLRWAVEKSLQIVKDVIIALEDMGRRVRDIVRSVLQQTARVVNKVVQALVALGRGLADMIKAVLGQRFRLVRKLVDAFIKVGKRTMQIIRECLNRAKQALTYVIRALRELGRSIRYLLGQVISLGYQALKSVVKALLALGNNTAKLLSKIMAMGRRLIRAVTRALATLGRRVSRIIAAVANAARNVLQAVMQGLKAAAQSVSHVLSTVVRYTGRALKRLIRAFYVVFRSLTTILRRFAEKSVRTLQMLLEGLFAAGVSFVVALGKILKNVAEQFRKGFFQGLIALGKSMRDIMVEALKLTGGLAALAFAIILDIAGGHRGLTATEREAAEQVFGASIDLNSVRIAVASLPADLILALNGGRAFTTMKVINFASWQQVELDTLIHEMTHLWQGVVAGPVYMVEALHEQFTKGNDAYRITLAMLRDNNGNFASFGREQQATIVEHYYQYRYGSWQDQRRAEEWLEALYPYARQVYRPRFSIPFSSFPFSPVVMDSTIGLGRTFSPLYLEREVNL